METITYEELMEVNGGRRVRGAGRVRGRRRSWWSRHKRTIKSYGKAAGKGFGAARAVIWVAKLFI